LSGAATLPGAAIGGSAPVAAMAEGKCAQTGAFTMRGRGTAPNFLPDLPTWKLGAIFNLLIIESFDELDRHG
jgi:hypothetical protein